MKSRAAVVVLVSALASAPAQAGWFGGKDKKKLPQAVSTEQHLGHYGVHPTRVKARNRADGQDAGHDVIRKFQRRPVAASHPYVTGLR
jgi:hypothetical protein